MPYGYKEAEDHFILDMEAIRKGVRDGARILIYNNYQNPTGASSPKEEMEELARLALRNDISFSPTRPILTSATAERSFPSPGSRAWPKGRSSSTPSARNLP